MRQLSAPCRWAVQAAAALAVLASAGCMSVSDDEGRKPAPSTSAERRGAAAEPDGGHGAPGGRPQGRGGKGDKDGRGKDDPKASPSAKDSASAEAKPTKGGKGPQSPAKPAPTGDGSSPSVPEPSTPAPDVPSEPPPSSTPPAGEPTDQPSASSAPEVHAGALRLVREPGTHTEPVASPQVGPV
ncbi:hypothetical protein [Streptomyces sp. NPDC002889]|uniref:hypothetical protein n=1 Tax=Streptomyces sp. NPDC002889 TaxID=3364669 RepID=UPI0036868D29